MINVLVWKTFLSKTFSYFPNKSKIIILTIVLLSIICFDEDLVFGYFSYTVLLIFAIACKMMKNTPLKLQNVNSQTMSQFIVKKKKIVHLDHQTIILILTVLAWVLTKGIK